ncbi:MAG TPA: putative Ig domain-containing protein [Beutenbergiaceae bacterium]|nr:putative Ig domain-containing protein [Beutenbergiaceae bacterium]
MSIAVGDNADLTLHVGGYLATRAYLGSTPVWDLPPLTMVVEGTEFEPVLELVDGESADIDWLDDDGVVLASGVHPTITFPDATPRTVTLRVSNPSVVETLNLGFHEGQDNGRESLPSSYRHPTQPVTSIRNLQNLTGLKRFMAARTNGSSDDYDLYTGPLLGGFLDFTGMTTIEYIETFRSEVSSVSLRGCTSLIRLCLEGVALDGPLDLNPVRYNLRDLRAAVQQTGSLTIAPLNGPMMNLWHFCTRGQVLHGLPGMEDLPNIEQLWIWNNGLNLETLAPRSEAGLNAIYLSGSLEGPGAVTNRITHLDFQGTTWNHGRLYAEDLSLESVNFAGASPLTTIWLSKNSLDQAAVDDVLAAVDSWGTSGGTLELDRNGTPSAAGRAHADALTGRGWTVTYDDPTPPSISTTSVGALEVGTAVTVHLYAEGTPPITWSVTAGTLPDGLSLSADGTLQGTPTTASAYDFTVTAINAHGSDTRQYEGAVNLPDGTLIWEDTFERADATGWANSGGWHPAEGETDTDVSITDGALVLEGASAYRRFLHSAGGSLPPDITVEVEFTLSAANRGTYWGICARVDPVEGDGVKAFFIAADGSNFRIGNATTHLAGTATDIRSALPATWTDPGPHTISMRCVGDTITVFCDDVMVHQENEAINDTATGGEVGFCGEPQNRAWDYIRVYSAVSSS